jgi:ABC-2 type transport system ATP-binding protein
LIEVRNLTKTYGDIVAVSDLTFTIESGRIYGFLGPNGAGKTTTLNMITGCLAATSGEVLIGGHDIFEEAGKAKKLIGYLPEVPPLYLDMKVNEYLDFVAKAKGVPRWDRFDQIHETMELTGINQVSDRLIRNLSKGYRQRLGIAQALLGRPEVIILDEPTVGLDPKQIIEIRELIKDLGKTHTVIFSSHILSEVRTLCDHIMIISRGRLVASDTPENLERLLTGTSTIELKVRASELAVRRALNRIGGVAQITYRASEADDTADVVVETDGKEDLSEKIFFAFCDIRRPILRMNLVTMSLEDVFIELTADKEEKGYETITGLGENGYPDSAGEEEALSAADEKPAGEPDTNGENPDVTEGARE